jgi:hypothetical protein
MDFTNIETQARERDRQRLSALLHLAAGQPDQVSEADSLFMLDTVRRERPKLDAAATLNALIGAVKEHKALTDEIESVSGDGKAEVAALKAKLEDIAKAHSQQFSAMIARHRAEKEPAEREVDAAEKKVKRLADARAKRTELETQADTALAFYTSPAERDKIEAEKRRWHLTWGTPERRKLAPENRVRFVEFFARSLIPSKLPNCADLAPLPGQSEDELHDLYVALKRLEESQTYRTQRAAIITESPVRFNLLASPEFQFTVRQLVDEAVNTNYARASEYIFIPAPGQSQADVDALLKKVRDETEQRLNEQSPGRKRQAATV